jgi:outer membrane immunogenic protein
MQIKRVACVAFVVVALIVPPRYAAAYTITGGIPSQSGSSGAGFRIPLWSSITVILGALALAATSRSSAAVAPVNSFSPEPDPADHPAIKAMKLDEVPTVAQSALAYANRRVPLKAPEDRRPFSPQPWGGFYIGADLGSIGGPSTWTDTFGDLAGVPGDKLRVDQSGVLGGLHAGYDVRSGQWIYGIEGNVSWSGGKGDATLVLPPAVGTFTSETQWLASAMGRAGILLPGPFANQSSVAYVKAGVAFAEFRNSFVLNGALGPFVFPAISNTSVGFALGGGIDMSIGENWSVRTELTYYDFGKEQVTFSHPIFGPARMDIENRFLVSKIGLTKHF